MLVLVSFSICTEISGLFPTEIWLSPTKSIVQLKYRNRLSEKLHNLAVWEKFGKFPQKFRETLEDSVKIPFLFKLQADKSKENFF